MEIWNSIYHLAFFHLLLLKIDYSTDLIKLQFRIISLFLINISYIYNNKSNRYIKITISHFESIKNSKENSFLPSRSNEFLDLN